MRGGRSALLGLALLAGAALLVDGTREALGACVARDDYRLTELEVVDVQAQGQSRRKVLGRVLTTGEQVWIDAGRFPELLRSRDGVVFRMDDPQALRGRRLPIWFNPTNAGFAFGDLRVLRAADGAAVPGWASVCAHLLALGTTLGLAALLLSRAR